MFLLFSHKGRIIESASKPKSRSRSRSPRPRYIYIYFCGVSCIIIFIYICFSAIWHVDMPQNTKSLHILESIQVVV